VAFSQRTSVQRSGRDLHIERMLVGSWRSGSRGHGSVQAISGFYTALKEPFPATLGSGMALRDTIVGLWLGPTLPFLLTHRAAGNHSWMASSRITGTRRLALAWISLIFGIGVTAWSFVLPRISEQRALRTALVRWWPFAWVCFC